MTIPARLAVGDLVFLPDQVDARHPFHAVSSEIVGKPGRIVSIIDSWAMVDRGQWGQWGQ